MKKILNILLIISAALTTLACQDDSTEEIIPEKKSGFNIEIIDLHSSHCKVKVTPDNPADSYFLGVATEEYFSTFGSIEDIETAVSNYIETEILMNQDIPLSDMLKKGVYEREVTGLQPKQRFIVFACHTDNTGTITSDIEYVIETTPEITASVNSFEIEIDQITATSAMLFITPSNDDDYVWLEFPEFVYADMTMEELEAFLLQNYKPFFPLHTNSGEMVHSFDGKLEPDTEYMIIVFGYDGGFTTPLTTKKFRTLKPNDATNVTFEFSYSDLTPHSVNMTFTPSDNSVSYLAIVVDEATLERSGGPTEAGVKKLIDKEIQKAILLGDCENRAEFAEYYAQRGKQTGSFSVEPGMKHYACAVCVDTEGEYASEVGIAEFTAPEEATTDASVSAAFDRWFDGDALAELDKESYGDYAGWAVLPIRFNLEGSASDAIYTIYPVSIINEEGATDEDIRALLLDNSLLGEYNFYIESKVDVQLEWDCDYRLYMIAFDEKENAGELVSMDIPALTRSGASPATEF